MAASNAPAPVPSRAFRAEPYDYTEARRLAAALDLAEPIAVMLVRRGYRTVEQASDFLEARDDHDPFAFEGMEDVCERILSVARRGGRITVHGDYDVDGVTSTTILVSVLRELGADADWLIPDRLADGYGLTMAGVEELRSRGTQMVITADCGIGSAAEVAAAREAGIEAIVTDHHEPPRPADLPDCPIVHPVVSGYPFSALCAAGVAHKLSMALREAAGTRFTETAGGRRDAAAAELDLVALATVADLVPADRREPQARPPGPRRDAGLAAPRPAGADDASPRSSPRPWTSRPSASGSPRGSTRPGASTAPTRASS